MSDESEIVLPATLGIEETCEIADKMREAGPEAGLTLDATAVEQMSTPFVLTLLAAIAERGDTGPKLSIKNPSGVFTDAFSDLGLFGDLMKMEFTS